MGIVIVDVREPFEFASGHVEGAVNIPPAKLLAGMPKELEGIPKDTQLVLYCRTGSRSNASMPYFQQLGFTKLINGINKDHVERALKSK